MNHQKTIGKRQDRLLAFFDAVMAIAMTVLALEITFPQLSAISPAERYAFFSSLTCYLISFVAMSTLWYVHNNFFSSHDLTGNNMEIVLHLVLLFVITLFQPLTRAIGEHPEDPWIRLFYLVDFFAMYGLTALIMVSIRRHENLINEKWKARKTHVLEKREELTQQKAGPAAVTDLTGADGNTGTFSTAEHSAGASSAAAGNTGPSSAAGGDMRSDCSEKAHERTELRRILQLVYAIENPEVLQEKLAEYMPEEYKADLAELKKKREASYRMSLYAVFTMSVAVLVAVVTLIFSIAWSYMALAAGLIVIFVIRMHEKRVENQEKEPSENAS